MIFQIDAYYYNFAFKTVLALCKYTNITQQVYFLSKSLDKCTHWVYNIIKERAKARTGKPKGKEEL